MNYKEGYKIYLAFLKENGFEINKFTEFKFEAINNFSMNGCEDDVLDWYWGFVKSSSMKLEQIPLRECKEWTINEDVGCIEHSSGEFFRVEGYRITGTNSREVTLGWDQPFLTQEGHDGGILGLIRQRFNSMPHYLVEAKEEPGNYNIVQISPTVQATFSNLKLAHKGNQTHYSDLFLKPGNHPVKVLFDQWTSEDGGRLYNKRNRSMLLEYDEKHELKLMSKRFRWVSLFQLKRLIREQNAIVSPHIRGILSVL
jgi:dTDP-4-dehydro-6-deoxy-alpha-D-glucopyranose 2,3-dehydratase